MAGVEPLARGSVAGLARHKFIITLRLFRSAMSW
jgi:hypothetical protein